MSDKKVKDTVRTKIFAVVSVVMGVIASIIITLNAYIDLVFDCRRSLIVSLILASLYVFLGITFRKVCRRSKERLSVQVISLIASILLVPSTVPVLTAMYALTFMPYITITGIFPDRSRCLSGRKIYRPELLTSYF